MKHKIQPTLLISLFLCCSYTAQAQFKNLPIINLFFKNQFDQNGLHHGRWTFSTEDTGQDEKMEVKGRYKHGLMVGNWRTYDNNKQLRKLEKGSIKESKNYIETTEFHASGQVAKKGNSIMDRTSGKVRFYREGDWVYYNSDGTLDKTVRYTDGWPTRTTYADGRVLTSKPQKSGTRVVQPGEKTPGPGPGRPGFKVVKDKETQQMIMIEYFENGDSTVKVLPSRQER